MQDTSVGPGPIKCSRPAGHPHVLLITIDRPPVNAMTVAAHRALRDALRTVDDDPSIRCIVLTGAGDRAFVAGGDVAELGALDPELALERTRVVRQVFDAIRRNPVPVIAAVNGHALGSGLVMVSQCDVIVAAESASFGLPEITVGVMGGTKHLARIVPEKLMRWMALTGNRVDAAHLARLGVIHKVVPRSQVLSVALQVAVLSMAGRVLRWQQTHGRRGLPWQNTRDPYRVWLSEVMLQQTQVSTASAYYLRFLERLPTVQALAAASDDEVLGLWSGLGYYSRARNLHRCAQHVVARHGGEFPRASAVLAQLPGIGRSTAAAIASLCFGERTAILDANVRRVLTRWLAYGDDLAVASNERRLWDLAQALLPRRNLLQDMPRYTQGMMDLGATLCLARQPRCANCPLSGDCGALRLGTPQAFPIRRRKLKRSAVSGWLLWAQTTDGSVWLAPRPRSGIWGGLYCLPWFDSREQLEAALPPGMRGPLHDLQPFKHVLTHRDLHLHPVQIAVPRTFDDRNGGRWFGAADWPALGLPAPVRGLLSQVGSQPKDVVG